MINDRQGRRPSLSPAQLEAAISAARELSANQEARHRQGMLGKANGFSRRQIRSNQGAAQTMLTEFLQRNGFDFDKLNQLRAQEKIELGHLLEEQKAEAARQSSQVKDTLRQEIDERRRTFEYLAGQNQAAALASYYILDTPFWISWNDTGEFQYHIEPWNSYAKIHFNIEALTSIWGVRDLQFWFFWENDSPNPATIHSVNTSISLFGVCSAVMPPVHSFISHSSLDGGIGLNAFELWTHPATRLHVYNDTLVDIWIKEDFYDLGETQGQEFSNNYSLFLPDPIVVPPGASLLFDTDFFFYYLCDDGIQDVDFFTGDYEIGCPFVSLILYGP